MVIILQTNSQFNLESKNFGKMLKFCSTPFIVKCCAKRSFRTTMAKSSAVQLLQQHFKVMNVVVDLLMMINKRLLKWKKPKIC